MCEYDAIGFLSVLLVYYSPSFFGFKCFAVGLLPFTCFQFNSNIFHPLFTNVINAAAFIVTI